MAGMYMSSHSSQSPCRLQLINYSNINEWDNLAKWVVNNKLISHNVRWLVQVPRLYEVFKGQGLVDNFEDVVRSA